MRRAPHVGPRDRVVEPDLDRLRLVEVVVDRDARVSRERGRRDRDETHRTDENHPDTSPHQYPDDPPELVLAVGVDAGADAGAEPPPLPKKNAPCMPSDLWHRQ